jgi:hypothetical protein
VSEIHCWNSGPVPTRQKTHGSMFGPAMNPTKAERVGFLGGSEPRLGSRLWFQPGTVANTTYDGCEHSVELDNGVY